MNLRLQINEKKNSALSNLKSYITNLQSEFKKIKAVSHYLIQARHHPPMF